MSALFFSFTAEHREGFCCSVWGDPQRGYEVGAICDQIAPPGRVFNLELTCHK